MGRKKAEAMAVYKPMHGCAERGCPELAERGKKYCEKHAYLEPQKDYDKGRSGASRGYGKKWQAFRKNYLASHPLCVECLKQGRYVQATDVDHIIAHRGNMELFWDEKNLQPLCHSCHSKKTNAEDHYPVYEYDFKQR